MKTRSRLAAFVLLFISITLLALLAQSLPGGRGGAQATAPRSREEAYRANNLGVALLEQFRHKEGAEQFRRALALDPNLALARINLAIALFNVPDIAAALKEAQAAAVAAPQTPQPHYLLGLIAKQQGRVDDSVASFQRVLKIDPRDVGANVQLGQLYAQQRKYAEAAAAFRTALSEEPYNGTALYNLGTALLRAGEREEGQRIVQQFQALRQSGAATIIGQNYLEQGRYAEAVTSTGAEPDLVDKTTPDVSFAEATAAASLPAPQPSAPAQGSGSADSSGSILGLSFAAKDYEAAKSYVGVSLAAAATLFDSDGDGDLDLFEAKGEARRLYRNDGGKFADVTEQSGALKDAPARLIYGAAAGDYDNDERADLLLLEEGGVALFKNAGGGRFARAQSFAHPYASTSAAFVDADHDGDLDIFVAGLADISKPPQSYKPGGRLSFPADFGGAQNLLLRNNGDGTFADVTAAARVSGGGRAVAVVPTDYDNRRDVDLFVLNFGAAPQLFRNLRDGSFRDVAKDVGLDAAGDFTCVAAGDVNKDQFTDFFLGGPRAAGQFAISDGKGRFRVSDAPAAARGARAAQFLDYDNDGLLDLLIVAGGQVRVLRNVGDGWADVTERASRNAGTGSAESAPSLASGDVDGDGDTDLLVRDGSGALRLLRNEGGNRNASVRVRLAGKVSNRGGVGAKVEARAGSLRQKLETYSVAPAPAPADVTFGLGKRESADTVRILWPSGVVQAETETAAGAAGGAKAQARTLPVTELDRKPSSCPYLYAWNGERFEFITDFMGGGELGYWAAPGVRAAPDPDEYVRIRGEQLRERGGRYELRVTNELEEALFIDRLQLVAVAHPSGVEVFPNEGLGNPTSSSFKLYAARGARPPRAAYDDRGRDVLPLVSHMDRKYPEGFELKPIRGYAERHSLTLDLGVEEGKRASVEEGKGRKGNAADARRLSRASSSSSRTLLLLTGWTDYAFSSDNVAAAQQGLTLSPPELQVKTAAGEWRTVIKNIGIPVGRPQTVTVDLTGKFLSGSREVRIVTNMRIYWDQILLDTSGGEAPLRVERLEASRADLGWRGFSAQVTPDGREPYGYDYTRVSDESPWKILPGRYTRFGDVRELLGATDDMFVVSRPGDELALSFDARRLAPLPDGWTRTFLLYSDGFSKEMDINSASPHELAPLPFHGMKEYPYSAPERYPSTPAHRAYVERYNTRTVSVSAPEVYATARR